MLKLDDRTLPSGYRGSTQSLQVQRATRGKALEFNFGASIHRVIGLDLVDAVFEPGSIEMRPIWVPRLELLMTELRAAPAVLRLSYLADLEEPQLVEQRLARCASKSRRPGTRPKTAARTTSPSSPRCSGGAVSRPRRASGAKGTAHEAAHASPVAQSSELRRAAGTSPPRFVIRARHGSLCPLRAPITIAPICDAHRLPGGTLSSIVRSDSDKGKTTERWRRKVTGLKSDSSTIAGPPRIPAERSAEVVRSRQAVAAGRVERGDHEFERLGQCRSVRQQRRSYAHDRRLRHGRGSVQPVDADAMKSSFIGVSALVLQALAALVPAGAASAAAPRSLTHPLAESGMTPWTTSPEVSRGSGHHERRADLDHQVGRRYAAERLRLQRSEPASAAFPVARALPFFSLGSFVHHNFVVGDPSLTSVQLDVVLVISVDGVPRPPLTFTYTFNHVETPNCLDPCPLIQPRPLTGARTVCRSSRHRRPRRSKSMAWTTRCR